MRHASVKRKRYLTPFPGPIPLASSRESRPLGDEKNKFTKRTKFLGTGEESTDFKIAQILCAIEWRGGLDCVVGHGSSTPTEGGRVQLKVGVYYEQNTKVSRGDTAEIEEISPQWHRDTERNGINRKEREDCKVVEAGGMRLGKGADVRGGWMATKMQMSESSP